VTASQFDDSPSISASERIADELRELILIGEYKPGDWLRQEDIAERFGASRLPVRVALRILEAEGLAVHEPRRGARVPLLSPIEVSVIYKTRERLEPLALLESLPHLTEEDLAELVALQHEIEQNDDVSRFVLLDRAFHLLTYSRCPSDQLNAMVTRMWNSTQYYRREFVQAGDSSRMKIVNAEHQLLLDAILRRDGVDAERYLAGHIRRTRVQLTRQQ